MDFERHSINQVSMVVIEHHFCFVTVASVSVASFFFFIRNNSTNHELICLTKQSAPDALDTKQGMALLVMLAARAGRWWAAM